MKYLCILFMKDSKDSERGQWEIEVKGPCLLGEEAVPCCNLWSSLRRSEKDVGLVIADGD